MSVRAPKSLNAQPAAGSVDVLEYEVIQEKASTLGRLTQNFEKALAALSAAPDDEALLDAAGEALWFFVIQRELCGLRNTDTVLRDYRVPAAVRLRMGVARR
jgi:hypothetical protein